MKRFDKFVQNRKLIYALAALAAGLLCVLVFCYVVFVNLGNIGSFFAGVARVLTPVIIGLVLAYIIDPVAKFFEKKIFKKMKKDNVRRTVSAIIALILVVTLFIVFIGMLVPSLISSVSMLIENADIYYASIQKVVDKINTIGFGVHIDLSSIEYSVKNWLGNLVNNLSQNLSSILDTTKNIGATVVNILIGVILAVYFMFGKKHLLTGMERLRRALLTPQTYERRTRFWNRVHEIFTQYIGCNVIDAIIIGVSNAIFMIILGMPYVPLVSFVVGICNLIPTFGPIIGAVIGALVLVLVKPSFALWFLVFTIGIQILDAYVIKPRLFSSSFGLPGVWTLIAITVGGNLFGIVGILLAIPVAAIIAFLYDEHFIPWLQKKSSARAEKKGGSKTPPEEADDGEEELTS